MIDIDQFKVFNDSFGHQAEDNVLARVASALSNVVKRPGDFVAHYGGEEFAAVLPKTDLNGALLIAGLMRQSVEELNITTPCHRPAG